MFFYAHIFSWQIKSNFDFFPKINKFKTFLNLDIYIYGWDLRKYLLNTCFYAWKWNNVAYFLVFIAINFMENCFISLLYLKQKADKAVSVLISIHKKS